MESLEQFISSTQERFNKKLSSNLQEKKRATDLRLIFSRAVREKFPQVKYPWLQKHNKLAKILLNTYSPSALPGMIDWYLTHPDLYQSTGISFDSFYFHCSKISTMMAQASQKAVAVEERKKKTDPQPATESDIQHFAQSSFFKKLPPIFQKKVLANGEEK